MQNDYAEPEFEVILLDENNLIFCAASGGGTAVGLPTSTTTNGTW